MLLHSITAEINGSSGQDVIRGNGGADTINGGDGDDTLNGNAGDEAMNGDEGSDWLSGDDQNSGDDLTDGAGNPSPPDELWRAVPADQIYCNDPDLLCAGYVNTGPCGDVLMAKPDECP